MKKPLPFTTHKLADLFLNPYIADSSLQGRVDVCKKLSRNAADTVLITLPFDTEPKGHVQCGDAFCKAAVE